MSQPSVRFFLIDLLLFTFLAGSKFGTAVVPLQDTICSHFLSPIMQLANEAPAGASLRFRVRCQALGTCQGT